MDAFCIDLIPEEVIAPQLKHWRQPSLFGDCEPFLELLASRGIRTLVVSNVDRADILSAIHYHG